MNDLDIKKRRKELGYTQKELAEILGVSENTVYNYEKGKFLYYNIALFLRSFTNCVHVAY